MPRPKKWDGPVVRKTIQISEALDQELADAVQLAELPEADVLREIFTRGLDAYLHELCAARPEKLKQRIRELRHHEAAWKLFLQKKDTQNPSISILTPLETVTLVRQALEAYHELQDLGIPFEPEDLSAEEAWQNLLKNCSDQRRQRHWQALEDLRAKGYMHLYLYPGPELRLEFDEAVFNPDLDWTLPGRKAVASLRRSHHLTTSTPDEPNTLIWTGEPP